jgi:hypothetical protein
MSSVRSRLASMVAVALAVTLLAALAVPYSVASGVGELAFRFDFGLVVAATAFFIIAVSMFFLGLKGFKPGLKRAYVLICAGVLCIVSGVIILPLLTIFNLNETWLVTTRAVAIPYLFSGVLIYMGVRKYAKLLNITSLWTKAWFVAAFVVAGLAITALIPHAPQGDELEFDIVNGLIVAISLFIIAAAIVALAIKNQSSGIYTNPLAWLFIAIACTSVPAIVSTAFRMFGMDNWFTEAFTDFSIMVVGILYIRSGYAFTRITTSDIN